MNAEQKFDAIYAEAHKIKNLVAKNGESIPDALAHHITRGLEKIQQFTLETTTLLPNPKHLTQP
jgi:hypothetical protein